MNKCVLYIRRQLNVLNPFFVETRLKEGTVITVKPGMCKLPICVSSILTLLSSIGVSIPAYPQFPKHSHGFGMPIEDEVLVGVENSV